MFFFFNFYYGKLHAQSTHSIIWLIISRIIIIRVGYLIKLFRFIGVRLIRMEFPFDWLVVDVRSVTAI